MKRQKFRKSLALISFLFFPVTISYISPAVMAEGASLGIVTVSLLIGIALFVTSLFVGRLWCGYLCPVGAVQDLYTVVKDKPAAGGKWGFIKVLVWVPWLGMIIVNYLKLGGFKGVDFLFMTQNGVSMLKPGVLSGYFGLLAGTLILTVLFGKRAFCHYVCAVSFFPIFGTGFRKLFKIPGLYLTADSEKCSSCGGCEAICPMSLDIAGNIKEENVQKIECVMCGECVDKCPNDALGFCFGLPKKVK